MWLCPWSVTMRAGSPQPPLHAGPAHDMRGCQAFGDSPGPSPPPGLLDARGPSMAVPASSSFSLFPVHGAPGRGPPTLGLAQGFGRTFRIALGPYPEGQELTDPGTWDVTSQ